MNHHIPTTAVEQTRTQLQEYQRFRELTDELVEVSDRICQFKAKAGRTAKKGGCTESRKALGQRIIGELTAEVERLMAALLARHLNADTSDGEAPTIPCQCGGEARFAGGAERNSSPTWMLCGLIGPTISVRTAGRDSVPGTGSGSGRFGVADGEAHDGSDRRVEFRAKQ